MSKPASRELIRKLVIEWPKAEAGLGEIEVRSQEPGDKKKSASDLARLVHASEVLGRPISTFNDLSMAEGLKLLSVYKEATGEEFKPAAVGYGGARRWSRKRDSGLGVRGSGIMLVKIAEIASELFLGNWLEPLKARCMERFRHSDPRALTPGQARSLVEELMQRLAVKRIRERRDSGIGIRDTGKPEQPISRVEIEAEKEVLRRRFFSPPIESAEPGQALEVSR
jgi:hypothetical protein